MSERPGTDIEPALPPARGRPDQTELREYLLLLPRFVQLLWRLTRDPRVPARSKATLLLLGGYLALPFDIVPDFIPVAGQIDDIMVIAFALDQIVNRVPPEIVREHWDGDGDVLEIIKEILDISTAFIPARLKKRFGSR